MNPRAKKSAPKARASVNYGMHSLSHVHKSKISKPRFEKSKPKIQLDRAKQMGVIFPENRDQEQERGNSTKHNQTVLTLPAEANEFLDPTVKFRNPPQNAPPLALLLHRGSPKLPRRGHQDLMKGKMHCLDYLGCLEEEDKKWPMSQKHRLHQLL